MPIWLSRPDGDLFAFAGIWAELPARDESSEPLHSCAIVTCAPNGLIRPIHDRMPVVLQPGAEETVARSRARRGGADALLVPAPEDALVAREVGDFVNDVRDDGPHLIERRAEEPQLF